MTDANQPQTAVAVRQPTPVQNVQPMLDTAKFEHFQRASSALMHSSILNESVRGISPQQCFSNLMLVFDLSDRWKLPALSIAQGIAIVHNKVVYEGKLIAAMLDASLGVRLQYWYTGERGSEAYRVYCSDRPFTELAPVDATPAEQIAAINGFLHPGLQIPGWRIIDGSVGEWRTFQKDGNKPNPAWTGAATQNQLAYRGSREWARRFEPAQMLGVYGDDEMDAATIRIQARDITPTPAPGLSGGMTRARPAEAEALESIGEVEEITATAEDAPQEPQEPTHALADPAAGKKPSKAKAGAESGAAAKANRKAELDAAAELDREKEEYYRLGVAGTPVTPPDWFVPSDKGLEERWAGLRAEWARGAEAGTLERKADQSTDTDAVEHDLEGEDVDGGVDPDSALGALREAEPDLVDQVIEDHRDADQVQLDGIETFLQQLPELSDWKGIKAAMNAMTKSQAWAQADPARHAGARRAAWLRMAQIIEAGDDRLDFITDLTAFRCWIETTQDIDAINGNWMAMVRMPLYTALAPENQRSLQQAVMNRVEEIQKGNG